MVYPGIIFSNRVCLTPIHPKLLRGTLADLSFQQINDVKPTVKVTFRGKMLGIFGAAPDRSIVYDNFEALDALMSWHQFHKVICLDSRRVNIAHPQLPASAVIAGSGEVRFDNLLTIYAQRYHVDCYNHFNGMRLDLADKFELETQKGVLTERFSMLMKQLRTKENRRFWGACQASDINYQNQKNFFDYIAQQHTTALTYPPVKEVVDNLVFFPSPQQFQAFIDLITYSYDLNERVFIHCASGYGRTGLYLHALIRSILQCTDEKAHDIIDEQYHFSAALELDNYLFVKDAISKKGDGCIIM